MSLELHNKHVVDFYKKNKHISFEDVNVFMVDMLEKMMQSDPSPNLMNEMNKSLIGLQTKMETITKDITKLQNDTQNHFILKMLEMKDIYMEQLKSALTNNVSEKIQPILKEHTSLFLDKTQLLLNDLIPKNQEHLKSELNHSLQRFEQSIMKEKYNPQELTAFIHNLETKFNQSVMETNDKLLRSDYKLEAGFKELRELTNTNQQNMSLILNKMENSSSKGKLSENILFHILQGLYPCASIDCVGTQKETGDVMFIRRDKPTIMIENKNWDKNVPPWCKHHHKYKNKA